ncbi:hypothetical protein [Priestia megaterium]|uniref:hypothetical protein n=1 Tax=Priestia megaterium TaxID=1404 RepID=UPI002FFFFD95
MRKKFLNSFFMFTKLNLRNPFFLGALLITFLYVIILIYYCYNHVISNPGNILQLSSFLIQGLMLFFLLLGYFSVKYESEPSIKDILGTILKARKVKIFSNFCFVIFLNIVLCLTSILCFSVVYKLTHISTLAFYINSSLFIIIYWFFPFLISSFIGLIIGIWLENRKISFTILIFIWFLISPTNIYILKTFFENFGFSHFPYILQLGVDNPNLPYNTLKGYELSYNRLAKCTWWLGTVLSVLFMSLVIKQKTIFHRAIYLFLSLILIVASLLCIPFVAQENGQDKRVNSILYNTNIYSKYNNRLPKYGFLYEIKRYETTIQTDKKALFQTNIFLKNIQEKKKLIFILSHDFKVTEVLNKNKNKIPYVQKGDIIELHISDTKIPQGEIRFTYSGEGSPFTPTDKAGLYLPFYFSWLPSNTKHLPYQIDHNSVNSLPMQNLNEIDYQLTYKSKSPIYTNLKAVGDDQYSLKTESGVTLISGELKSKTIDGFNIIYPFTDERMMEYMPNYLTTLNKTFHEIENVLDIQDIELPNTILFSPVLEMNDITFSSYMWLHNSHLIVKLDPYGDRSDTDLLMYENLVPYHLISAVTWKAKGLVLKDSNMSIYFNSVFGDYINKRLGKKPSSESKFWISQIQTDLKDSNSKKIFKQVSSITQSKDNKLVEGFFKEWYTSLENRGSWKELSDLLVKYKGE